MTRYRTNQAYRAKREGKAYYLRHQNGARVRTDRTINKIWECADGRTVDEVRAELSSRTVVSGLMLDSVLKLMTAADMLRVESPAEVFESRNSADAAQQSFGCKANAAQSPGELPLVSVVIVNRNGADHLSTLLPSLTRQDYPNLEIVLVDNASKDDSVSLTRQFFPEAKIVELMEPGGFAGGNNLGIAQAVGEYVFLLNNDTELADDCVSRLVAGALDKPDLAAVVPKIYLWRLPKFINAVGNSVWPRGWGSDNYIGYLDIGQFDEVDQVFSACFGAVLISRAALEKVGLLDPAYRFYYEDADWSYRARLAGLKIYFEPSAAVYHKFNGSMQTLEPNLKWKLVIGNRLRFTTKNLSKGTWLNFMRNYAKEDLRGFLRSVKHKDAGMAVTYARAWSRFIIGLPGILTARRRIQKTRVLKDAALFKLWPELPPLLDQYGHPILDIATIRRIYLHFLSRS